MCCFHTFCCCITENRWKTHSTMTSRAEKKLRELQHFFDVILDLEDEDHPFCLAFQNHQMTQITNLLVLEEVCIKKLEYIEENGEKVPFVVPAFSKLLWFRRFVAYNASLGVLFIDNWTSIPSFEFQEIFTTIWSNLKMYTKMNMFISY